MYSAKYSEYLASLVGACIVAFGLGIVLADYFGSVAWLFILVGVGVHGWGMFKTHGRNKEREG